MIMTDEELLKRKRAGGRIGGLARVPKGTAKMSPERRREIALKGVEGRRKKREAQKQEA